MIGQSAAALYSGPRRWLLRYWGYPDIHMQQKWVALWPYLARLPLEGVRVLDAGCGPGHWSLELASRRPGWSVVGIDCDAQSVQTAEAARQRLGLENVQFFDQHFLQFLPEQPFHVVLSVHSAYHLAEAGKAEEQFAAFRAWLRPDGYLLLLTPRQTGETPLVRWLPQPERRLVFTSDHIIRLCGSSGLSIEVLSGHLGRLGAVAKQISWATDRASGLLSAALYPLRWFLARLGACATFDGTHPSLEWLLVARPTPLVQADGSYGAVLGSLEPTTVP